MKQAHKIFECERIGTAQWSDRQTEIHHFNTDITHQCSEPVRLYVQVAHSRTLRVNVEEEALLVLQGQVLCGRPKNQHNARICKRLLFSAMDSAFPSILQKCTRRHYGAFTLTDSDSDSVRFP